MFFNLLITKFLKKKIINRIPSNNKFNYKFIHKIHLIILQMIISQLYLKVLFKPLRIFILVI